MGQLDVLNVGKGHLKMTFAEGDEVELEKAKRVITDMLARGYSIFVETGDGVQRVRSFNPERNTYIIDDYGVEHFHAKDTGTDEAPEVTKKRGRSKKEVPVKDAKATAVGRAAGG